MLPFLNPLGLVVFVGRVDLHETMGRYARSPTMVCVSIFWQEGLPKAALNAHM